MVSWTRAGVDAMIRDFMEQLGTATVQGWERTRPDHYRAVVAALDAAMKERQGASMGHEFAAREACPATRSGLLGVPWLALLFGSGRPGLSTIPLTRHR